MQVTEVQAKAPANKAVFTSTRSSGITQITLPTGQTAQEETLTRRVVHKRLSLEEYIDLGRRPAKRQHYEDAYLGTTDTWHVRASVNEQEYDTPSGNLAEGDLVEDTVTNMISVKGATKLYRLNRTVHQVVRNAGLLTITPEPVTFSVIDSVLTEFDP
jgi:hypothetical protein